MALPKVRLFIVPWLAAIAPSAPKRALVTCWLVSTLPATTAAGYCGFSMEPSGTMMRIGRRQPAFIGIELSTMTRKT